MLKEGLNILQMMASIEDSQNITFEANANSVSCLNKKCDMGVFIIIREFVRKDATCPYCGYKHRVRCYKNGKVQVTIKS